MVLKARREHRKSKGGTFGDLRNSDAYVRGLDDQAKRDQYVRGRAAPTESGRMWVPAAIFWSCSRREGRRQQMRQQSGGALMRAGVGDGGAGAGAGAGAS